jgi:hypothetical protein
MTERKNKKCCMFYPEDPFKTQWDLFITLVLIFTCIESPYRISVGELESLEAEIQISDN